MFMPNRRNAYPSETIRYKKRKNNKTETGTKKSLVIKIVYNLFFWVINHHKIMINNHFFVRTVFINL